MIAVESLARLLEKKKGRQEAIKLLEEVRELASLPSLQIIEAKLIDESDPKGSDLLLEELFE